MNLENALQVPGFTNANELLWLAEQASKRNNIAEIGSWKGRSTRAMADNTTGRIVAVDTWQGTPEDWHMQELAGKPEDWLYNEFWRNVGASGKVTAFRMSSLAAAYYLAERNQKFDMIFIDAAHDYQAVKDDILAWRPLLTPGGLFCGHDYYPKRGGVIPAVDECCGKVRRIDGGTIWVAG